MLMDVVARLGGGLVTSRQNQNGKQFLTLRMTSVVLRDGCRMPIFMRKEYDATVPHA